MTTEQETKHCAICGQVDEPPETLEECFGCHSFICADGRHPANPGVGPHDVEVHEGAPDRYDNPDEDEEDE